MCTIQSEDGISFPFLSLLAVGIDGNGSLKNNNNNISTHTRKKERKKEKKEKKTSSKMKERGGGGRMPLLTCYPELIRSQVKWRRTDGRTDGHAYHLTFFFAPVSAVALQRAHVTSTLTHPPRQSPFFFLFQFIQPP